MTNRMSFSFQITFFYHLFSEPNVYNQFLHFLNYQLLVFFQDIKRKCRKTALQTGYRIHAIIFGA